MKDVPFTAEEFRKRLEEIGSATEQCKLPSGATLHIYPGARPEDSNVKSAAAVGKPKLSAVPPMALFALGAAMQDGCNKYGRFNWRTTEASATVFYDAMMRHLTAWYNGEDLAPDSKVNHLGHIMASCAILLDAMEHGVFTDNRNPNNVQAK